jgi:glycosyltransferase involved in cell wall biosynthesis
MRVVINAGMASGASGGVEQIVIGLASGLADVARAGEEYLFLTNRGMDAWLQPYIRGACRIVHRSPNVRETVRKLVKRIPGTVQLHRALQKRQPHASALPLPLSDGTAERLQADVVHFPSQAGFVTSIPSIYHPWDLQHMHYPEFFTPRQLLTRDLAYRTFCSQAAIVSVATQWGKRDLVEHLGVDAEKIEVVPVAPVLTAYAPPTAAEIVATRTRLNLPEQFAYYPAHSWPHKNHVAIIRALALLRSRGAVRHAVFSGFDTPYTREILAEAGRLGVRGQVHFLGFVSPLTVQCLYRLATCLIFPSRFEGWGLPVCEAYLVGVPVGSSNASCLPETTSGAALLFDPDDIQAIAAIMETLFTDEAVRRDLVRRGREVVKHLTWRRTAGELRELYLKIAARGVP